MILILEDNGCQNTSVLISKVMRVTFSRGNSNIKSIIADNDYRDCLVLIDVVPDNKHTITVYEDLVRWVEEYCANCYIFPNICTEYAILKSLKYLNIELKFKYTWLNQIYDVMLHGNTISNKIPKILGYKGSFYSYEKQCKALLNNAQEYLETNNDIDNKSSYYLNITDELDITSKALSICRYFRVCVFLSEIGITKGFTEVIDFKELETKTVNKWNKWYHEFKKVNIDIIL